ncbi:MAG: T9SS type A sorting domain-containing protein [Bacteroidales bacterium]|nr:T9SS type A sorting domain-containing protein [Bacteroidales bacterium]
MISKYFRFFKLFFLFCFINTCAYSQFPKNEIEKRKSQFQKREENPKDALARIQMLNAKNNKNNSEKKVLYSVDYGFFNEYIEDTLYYIINDWVWYDFDEYLNTKKITFNPYQKNVYSYTYDAFNRLSSYLKYEDYSDYYSNGYMTQQEIYKYDNHGRISEIHYENKNFDEYNPEYNYHNKSKSVYLYENSFLKQVLYFHWNKVLSIWINTAHTEYGNNYEIDKNYHCLEKGERFLYDYDSTYFNAAHKPKYRLARRYSNDSLRLVDVTKISHEYLWDTLLVRADQSSFKLHENDPEFYCNSKYYSTLEYDENYKLTKYQKYIFSSVEMDFVPWIEHTFEYDSIGNVVHMDRNQRYNDTLMFFTGVTNIKYDYSELYDNISNDVIPFSSEAFASFSFFSDYCRPKNGWFENMKHFDILSIKPINAIAEIYVVDGQLKTSQNNQSFYYDYERLLKVFNYKYLQAKNFEKPKIVIIPNPTSDNFRFFLAETYDKALIQIFDISGKQVLEREIYDNFVDVSFLRRGLYILKVKTNDNFWTEKFMKN